MFRQVGDRTAIRSARRASRERATRTYASAAGTTYVRPVEAGPKREAVSVRKHFSNLRIDIILLLVVVALLAFGLVMVYSASYIYSLRQFGNHYIIFLKQIAFMIVGIALASFLTFFDYHKLPRVVVPLIALTLFGLGMVLFAGERLNGAMRTLLNGSGQPSELAKLVVIIYLAVWLTANPVRLTDSKMGIIPLIVILGLVGSLIVAQPDFSSFITVLMLGGMMFFLAGGDLRQIALLIVSVGVLSMLVIFISDEAMERVMDFIAGILNPTMSSDQVVVGLEAFHQGGIFGTGIGRGQIKLVSLTFPHNDSIFAVVGEELGAVGAIVLVALFAILLWRAISISRHAPDDLGRLLAAGVGFWIAVEAFMNMAVMMSLLPVLGNALPFVSAGGSSLVMTMVGIGILFNISRLSEQKNEENEKFFDAVVNLRGWDRRRGVPRSNRAPGATSKTSGEEHPR